MKITDVKPYPVWIGHRNQMLVKVETDEGIYGWGEAGVSGRELAVTGAVSSHRAATSTSCWSTTSSPRRSPRTWNRQRAPCGTRSGIPV